MILTVIGFVYFNIFFPLAIYLGALLLVTSILGIDTGFHRKYVELLLNIFKYCQSTIEHRTDDDKKSNGDKTNRDDSDNEVEPFEEGHAFENLYHRVLDRLQHEDPKKFELDKVYGYTRAGIMSIIEDDVTKRFDSHELATWNLLTRTNRSYQYIHLRLYLYWVIGVYFRFFVLFPVRVLILALGMSFLIISMALVGRIPEGRIKRWLYHLMAVTSFRIISRSMSTIVTTHNQENKPKGGGICVANHTSPIDMILLSCDNAYALVAQKQGGMLGVIGRALERATHHVFFDRFAAKDRAMVTERLKEHASDKLKLPILIFPEGTCINNSAVMMFKKGAFEATDTIYPVAIKYDERLGDPFWNSSRDGFGRYFVYMMTSWAIVAEVWYLEPMVRRRDESAVDFASRAKAVIAAKGGLVDLEWDGQLKRLQVKPTFKDTLQKTTAKKLLVE